MKRFKEFLCESELDGLLRDLQALGYEEVNVKINGRIVEDFGEEVFKWRVDASGNGTSPQKALLRAISAAIQSIESEGSAELLRKGREIEIEEEVLEKAIRDKQIDVEEIGYRFFVDGRLFVSVSPEPLPYAKGFVGAGYAERITE
jgi:hypothetical protein